MGLILYLQDTSKQNTDLATHLHWDMSRSYEHPVALQVVAFKK